MKEIQYQENKKHLLEDGGYRFSHNITELVLLCSSLSRDAGWHKEELHDAVRIALIHSELSEALEGIRKGVNDDHLKNRLMVEVELADAIIRIFDLAGLRGYDLGGALVEKLIYNQSRLDHKKENRDKQGGKKF